MRTKPLLMGLGAAAALGLLGFSFLSRSTAPAALLCSADTPPYQDVIDTCIPTLLQAGDLKEGILGINASKEGIELACGPIATDCADQTILYYGTAHEIRITWVDPVHKRLPQEITLIGPAITLYNKARSITYSRPSHSAHKGIGWLL